VGKGRGYHERMQRDQEMVVRGLLGRFGKREVLVEANNDERRLFLAGCALRQYERGGFQRFNGSLADLLKETDDGYTRGQQSQARTHPVGAGSAAEGRRTQRSAAGASARSDVPADLDADPRDTRAPRGASADAAAGSEAPPKTIQGQEKELNDG